MESDKKQTTPPESSSKPAHSLLDLLAAIIITVLLIGAVVATQLYNSHQYPKDTLYHISFILFFLWFISNIFAVGHFMGKEKLPASLTARAYFSLALLLLFLVSLPQIIILGVFYTFYKGAILIKKGILKAKDANVLQPFPLAICVLLGIAIIKLPYGYYEFLRIAVTIWGIVCLISCRLQEPANKNAGIVSLVAGAIAILYNPILPIHLDKDTWQVINPLSIPVVLLCTYLTEKRTTGTADKPANITR